MGPWKPLVQPPTGEVGKLRPSEGRAGADTGRLSWEPLPGPSQGQPWHCPPGPLSGWPLAYTLRPGDCRLPSQAQLCSRVAGRCCTDRETEARGKKEAQLPAREPCTVLVLIFSIS